MVVIGSLGSTEGDNFVAPARSFCMRYEAVGSCTAASLCTYPIAETYDTMVDGENWLHDKYEINVARLAVDTGRVATWHVGKWKATIHCCSRAHARL